MARQQAVIRGLTVELEQARRQSERRASADATQANDLEQKTRQLLLQLEEVTAREAAWRRLTTEQATMSSRASALLRHEHEGEVRLLSEKIRQLADERAQVQATCATSLRELKELQAFCAQREADLSVLTQEVLRLRKALAGRG